jgi:hypothetical protein
MMSLWLLYIWFLVLFSSFSWLEWKREIEIWSKWHSMSLKINHEKDFWCSLKNYSHCPILRFTCTFIVFIEKSGEFDRFQSRREWLSHSKWLWKTDWKTIEMMGSCTWITTRRETPKSMTRKQDNRKGRTNENETCFVCNTNRESTKEAEEKEETKAKGTSLAFVSLSSSPFVTDLFFLPLHVFLICPDTRFEPRNFLIESLFLSLSVSSFISSYT